MIMDRIVNKPHTAPCIFVEDVSFSFAGSTIFSSLDFKVEAGKWTCLLGASGCGKTTLLRLISGSLRKGFSGRIRFDDREDPTGLTAWMAQKDLLLPWLSVLENVLLGDRLRGRVSEDRRKRAVSLLDRIGLGDYRNALPAALSGGMRQRAALLRTLMEERSVILMDEPFSSLDALTRMKLQNLAATIVKGATVLLVTHDPLEALRLGHRIHVMTGSPPRPGEVLIPPGSPPREPGDLKIAVLHAELLARLDGGG